MGYKKCVELLRKVINKVELDKELKSKIKKEIESFDKKNKTRILHV